MTNKKYQTSAIFAAAIALSVVFAAIPTTNNAYATTTKSGSVTWLDCVGNPLQGNLAVTVNTPPVTTAKFQSTNWPTSWQALGSDICAQYVYKNQKDSFTDVTQGWTFSTTLTPPSGPNKGITYSLGHTINAGDYVKASEVTTYKSIGFPDITRSITLSQWKAT